MTHATHLRITLLSCAVFALCAATAHAANPNVDAGSLLRQAEQELKTTTKPAAKRARRKAVPIVAAKPTDATVQVKRFAFAGNTLISKDGNEFEVDAVVFATGFEAIEPPFAPHIHGRNGLTLSDYWSTGMQALDSTTVAGFPNLFIMNGPNTGLGHNSVLYVVESQIDYILGGLDYMRERGAAVLEPRPESENDYVDEMIDRAAGTVWLTGGCKNWYVDYRTNRLTVTWPDFAYAFRDSNGEFVPEHYATA